jgi:hypothetical protein
MSMQSRESQASFCCGKMLRYIYSGARTGEGSFPRKQAGIANRQKESIMHERISTVTLGKPVDDDAENEASYRLLVINGETWEDTSASPSNEHVDFWGSSVPRIAPFTIEDLVRHFAFISISLPNAKKDLLTWEFAYAEIDSQGAIQSGTAVIVFRVEYDLEFWAKPYSIAEMATAIESVLKAHGEFGFEYGQEDLNTCIEGFGVSSHMAVTSTIQQVLDLASTLGELARLIELDLSKRTSNTVVASFNFPPSIRTACEQYLLYFVQFLGDLGIEAESELRENAGHVLFTVTPKDERQALGQIYDALQVYLQMPASPDFQVAASRYGDPAVGQLEANVLHLQSQLMLAKAVLMAKDAAIHAHQAEIAALQERLDLRAFLPPPKMEDKKSADSEPIIDGVLAIRKYDLKFLQIDFPEILRKLKRKFS